MQNQVDFLRSAHPSGLLTLDPSQQESLDTKLPFAEVDCKSPEQLALESFLVRNFAQDDNIRRGSCIQFEELKDYALHILQRFFIIQSAGKMWDASEKTLYAICAFLLLEKVLEVYLTMRQIRVYKQSKTVPKELQHVMTNDTFEKARVYGLDRAYFGVVSVLVCDVLIQLLELSCGFIALVWARSVEISATIGLNPKSEIQVGCLFAMLLNLVGMLKDMPFKIYNTFVLEEKHGFNKQTAGFFIKDQIKSLLLGQVLSLPIAAAFVYIVQIGGQYFFIWLFVFITAVSLLLITIYPVYIAPLFDKFRPLEDGELKQRIHELAGSVKFPLGQLFVVEGSKRSAHSNAYFTGLFVKRIVLFDTLLVNKGLPEDDPSLTESDKGKGCSNDEVLAVLAHELGHWKLGHVVKNILFTYGPVYEAIGMPPGEKPILLGFLVIMTYVLAPYNTMISFVMTVISRRFEYQSDAFAQQLGYAKDLGNALIKLQLDNLGFPVYDWMYSAWNHSHPTVLQRLARLKTIDQGEDKTHKPKTQ
uniref:Ste24 endopeptidase n=1 Tax=Anopheles stephensi TaxID=30069 RepID=A0A182Y8U6_ANOST